jgi:ATP-dependent DNA helicase RecG
LTTGTDSAVRPGSPLDALPGIGPVRSRRLAEAGYETVGDLLAHLPHRYEDRSTVRTVAEAVAAWREGGPSGASTRFTLAGRLESVKAIRVRRRGFSLVRGRLADDTGSLPVLWFNRPYLPAQVDGETEYLLHGELRAPKSGKATPELLNPSVEPMDRALHAGRVVPVDPSAGELGPAMVRRLVTRALEVIDLGALPESLPAELRARHGLPPLGEALRELHAPGSVDSGADAGELNARRSPAHRRLIYGELLEIQLALARLRAERQARPKRHRHGPPGRLGELAKELLPFRLTPGQARGDHVVDHAEPIGCDDDRVHRQSESTRLGEPLGVVERVIERGAQPAGQLDDHDRPPRRELA